MSEESNPDEREYFAACTLGLEEALAGELRELGAGELEVGRGGVRFRGATRLGYAAALWLRTAVRLQEQIEWGNIVSEDGLYDFARSIDWSKMMRVDQTLAVDASVRDSRMRHSRYAALRVKDAIVDQFRERERGGRRPSVDTKRPALPIKLHLDNDRATLYRDLGGGSLHKRGYRPVQVKSPLNESIAAGIVLMSEWNKKSPLCDPMCGSATLAIEAAWIAADRAPGLRRVYPFQRWPDFESSTWSELLKDAMKRFRPDDIPWIECADRHPGAIAIAQDAIQAASLKGRIQLVHTSLQDFDPTQTPSVVLCNPPYGERIGHEDLEESWHDLGDFLRRECPHATAFVLSGNPEIGRALRLKASRKFPIQNGPVDCRLLRYEVGARRDQESG